MIEIFTENWDVNLVLNNPDKLYVFGDNTLRVGKNGQAVIRDCENSIGLVTKRLPNITYESYLTDDEYDYNCRIITEDIQAIKEAMNNGKTIVFSSGGYGTGLAKLPERAPRTFEFLCDILMKEFNFDNRV